MPYEAQNLLHGGSHAAQCRGILSLIDTSRAGRTTLGMHLRSCELFGMQGGWGTGTAHNGNNNNNKIGLAYMRLFPRRCGARPQGTDWFGDRLGPVRSGATWRLREHGDPEEQS